MKDLLCVLERKKNPQTDQQYHHNTYTYTYMCMCLCLSVTRGDQMGSRWYGHSIHYESISINQMWRKGLGFVGLLLS